MKRNPLSSGALLLIASLLIALGFDQPMLVAGQTSLTLSPNLIATSIIPSKVPTTMATTDDARAVMSSSYDDEFDSSVLDPKWSWIREDPSHWSLAERPGFLRILSQWGSYSTGTAKNTAVQVAPPGDFMAATRVDFLPTQDWQQASIMIYENDQNLFAMARRYHSWFVGCSVHCGSFDSGNLRGIDVPVSCDFSPTELLVSKTGNVYRGAYRNDTGTWIQVCEWELGISPDYLALEAHNGTSGAGEIPADFDFIHVTSQEADLGFRPDPDGFQFPNRQLWRTWAMFEQFFGPENVTRSDGSRCKAAEKFFQDRYRTAANGWSCLGFSQASLLSYLEWTQANAGLFAMNHFDQLYQQPESTQLTGPIAYYSGVQTAQQWGSEWYSWLATCDSDSSQMIESIRVGIASGEPMIVNLNTLAPSNHFEGHAIAPYRVEEIEATAVDVYVYDSEQPGQERVIHFQDPGGGWQWTYTFVGSVGSAGTRTGSCKDMYPYALLTGIQQGIPPMNWCESPSSVLESSLEFSQRVLALVPAEGDWVIKDTLGRRLGWVNGEFVAEIPEAYAIPQSLGDAGLSHRSLYLPASPYTIGVGDSPTDSVEYSLFGDGSVVKISANLLSVGSYAELAVSSDLRQITLSELQDLNSFTLGMDHESTTESRWATVIGTDLTGGEDLSASFDGNEFVMSRMAGDLQYCFGLELSDGQLFRSQPLTLVGNETHSLSPVSWSDLDSGGVLLEIDNDSDGTVDETRLLQNIRALYLPLVLRGS